MYSLDPMTAAREAARAWRDASRTLSTRAAQHGARDEDDRDDDMETALLRDAEVAEDTHIPAPFCVPLTISANEALTPYW
jgi:hypothetical protein